MDFDLYLQKYQKVIYQTMTNAIKGHHLSHAYLISGEKGTPTLTVAAFFAKSLLCDNPSPLACNECLTCMRVDDGNYQDLIICNGEEKTIKKDDIQNIISSFSKTSNESKGIMIYIIHLVENMTTEAINSLLKFLEEPAPDIYAFLTTENENRVLPTILSRVQTLRIKLISRREVIDLALKEEVNLEDAELLSYFYNDADEIKNNVENDSYLTSKECLDEFLNGLIKGKGYGQYINQSFIDSKIRTKEMARFYLDMLSQIFHDLINIKNDNPIILTSYGKILNILSLRLNHIDESLLEIMSLRNKLELNLNIALLLDHLTYYIVKGANKNVISN